MFLYLYSTVFTSRVKLKVSKQKLLTHSIMLADMPGNLKSKEFENYYEGYKITNSFT